MDGVLFRAEPLESRKGLVTNNSYIIGETIVDGSKVKCYGRIQRFYLHFMRPPNPGELREATIDGKIDPNKIHSTPWCVLVWCKWYDKHGINPVNGLVQVQHRPNWNQGCPFIDFTHCLPRNCQCWPTVPFDVTKYDKDGKLIEGETDIMDRSEALQDVIEHHE